MEASAFDEVALQWAALRRVLPFEFSRKARTRPIRAGVRFEIAQVGDRFRLVNRPESGQGEVPPLSVLLRPVKRRVPALLVQRGPAQGKPVLRPPVASSLDEFEILAVGDQARGQPKGGNEGAMS